MRRRRASAELTTAAIWRALRRHEGSINRTAEALGVPWMTLRWRLKRDGLQALAKALRTERRHSREETLSTLIVEHRGRVSEIARRLGLATSTLHSRIEKYGLASLVREARPCPPTAKEERAQLRKVLQRHHGQMWRVREELGVSKGTLLNRIRKYNLFAEADALRCEAHLTGPRTRLSRDYDRAARRQKLVAVLESCDWKVVRAQKIVGVSAGTFYALMKELGIDRPTEALRAQRRQRLLEALRATRGILVRAARFLGVQDRTVSRWCGEFDLDPNEFRE